jgi:ribosomal protein S18 acetylase RimI-like enzyme
MEQQIVYKVADTDTAFEAGKRLFSAYVASLGIDLSFQGFSGELDTIAQQYNTPTGALLIAYADGQAVGCVGVRPLEAGVAELKRMYVQEAYRGYGIGVQLMERSLQLAKDLGYQTIRLDSLQHMTKALALYRAYGFYEIPAYRFNPLEGAIYMEKRIAD